jgi:hypothetical protein
MHCLVDRDTTRIKVPVVNDGDYAEKLADARSTLTKACFEAKANEEPCHPSPAGLASHVSHSPMWHTKSFSFVRQLTSNGGRVATTHWSSKLLRPLEVVATDADTVMIGSTSPWSLRCFKLQHLEISSPRAEDNTDFLAVVRVLYWLVVSTLCLVPVLSFIRTAFLKRLALPLVFRADSVLHSLGKTRCLSLVGCMFKFCCSFAVQLSSPLLPICLPYLVSGCCSLVAFATDGRLARGLQ